MDNQKHKRIWNLRATRSVLFILSLCACADGMEEPTYGQGHEFAGNEREAQEDSIVAAFTEQLEEHMPAVYDNLERLFPEIVSRGGAPERYLFWELAEAPSENAVIDAAANRHGVVSSASASFEIDRLSNNGSDVQLARVIISNANHEFPAYGITGEDPDTGFWYFGLLMVAAPVHGQSTNQRTGAQAVLKTTATYSAPREVQGPQH